MILTFEDELEVAVRVKECLGKVASPLNIFSLNKTYHDE